MTAKTQKLQSLLDAQVGKGSLHNSVAAVQSYDRSLDFVGSAGVADAGTGAAMTPEPLCCIASVKMYTAAIIMQLHQEKRLDSEAPLSDCSPDSLLDALFPARREGLTPARDLGDLLQSASPLTPPGNLPGTAAACAPVYGGEAIWQREVAYDRERQAQIAAYRARLVDGPALILPLGGPCSASSNPHHRTYPEFWHSFLLHPRQRRLRRVGCGRRRVVHDHAHAYYLIRNAELLGFAQAEIALVAAIAFYHRKGLPRPNDPQFAALDKRGQKVLPQLSLYLRIAESLDRGHAGVVQQARLHAAGKSVVLEIRSHGDVHLKIWGIENRKALLERALGHRLVIRVVEGQPIAQRQ